MIFFLAFIATYNTWQKTFYAFTQQSGPGFKHQTFALQLFLADFKVKIENCKIHSN